MTEVSDHFPLLLSLKVLIEGKKRFHFEGYWTKLHGFLEVVTESWTKPIQASGPMERISAMLKWLNRALQSWSQKEIGYVKTQHAIAREILHQLEIAGDSRVLTPDED